MKLATTLEKTYTDRFDESVAAITDYLLRLSSDKEEGDVPLVVES